MKHRALAYSVRQLDSSYEVAHVVSAANGLEGDVHEFKITDQGTAIMSIYEICQMDLSSVGKASDGWVYDGLFQELDIETGELLFEWRARDHYAANESFFDVADKSAAPTASDAYDYFHINSIDKKSDGTYLISSRYMHSVTCIGATGEILWILGGKRNMFKDLSGGSATDFTWQHDARWRSDNVITLLDNGANEHTLTSDHSRGLMISLDFDQMTATAIRIYDSPGRFSSHSQGNLQVLPKTGNIFIGWGKASAYTEFSLDGELLCDTHFGPSMFYWFGWVKSYRVQKANWVGKPSYPPDVAVADGNIHVSWNGATEVEGWVLQRAARPHGQDAEFSTLDYFPKTGFETAFALPTDVSGFLRVAAVDFRGEELGYTRVFEADSGRTVCIFLSFFLRRLTYASGRSRLPSFRRVPWTAGTFKSSSLRRVRWRLSSLGSGSRGRRCLCSIFGRGGLFIVAVMCSIVCIYIVPGDLIFSWRVLLMIPILV